LKNYHDGKPCPAAGQKFLHHKDTKFTKKKTNFLCVLCAVVVNFGCADVDYHQQAKAFHAQYAKSREVKLLAHYEIKRREENLYLQECQRLPDDSIKSWAIYEGGNADEAETNIELSRLRIAVTPFPDLESGKRVFPEYEKVNEADTSGTRRELVLHLREVIRAFHRLGLQEVICGGRDVVYFVQREFMIIYVPEADKAPVSVTNIATKLDDNWYYEISLEHQEAQRLKLINVLREFWSSVQSQQTDSVKQGGPVK
jgi:hypothetical protein